MSRSTLTSQQIEDQTSSQVVSLRGFPESLKSLSRLGHDTDPSRCIAFGGRLLEVSAEINVIARSKLVLKTVPFQLNANLASYSLCI